MKNFIRNFLFVLTLMAGTPALAQSIYSIKLHLSDEKTSEPVAFATASVTVKGEQHPLKYTLTDDKGDATITKLKKGTYILRAELMGYKTYTKEIFVEKNIELGTIKMQEDAEVLDAARVSDVGNPIVIKKDTVEYNASSFKTSDNDMLEQLLKKLPGIEVAADGSITANGETIKKITIDGKTFFLDDPQLASKNIPAKIVEKVKVVEKKSDQAMFTGIDDGEEETIIDLRLRPGMAQGWFGNIMGGGGHDVPGPRSSMNDWRYQGAAMVGRFTDKSQISIILNANNTNNRGFNDVAGGMMQGMRGGMGMGGRGGGFGGGNGISNTWMGGVNGAFTLFDGDMELGSNYLYNGSDKVVEEISSKTTYMTDGSSLLNENSGGDNTFSQGHRFGVRMEHKFSENTSLLFEPQFNFGSGNYVEKSDYTTGSLAAGATDTVKVNSGKSFNNGDNQNWSTSGMLLLRQRLGKAGRTISANVRYSFSNNTMQGYNRSLTSVSDQTGIENPDQQEIVNQYFDQNSNSTSLSGRLVYTEPLAEKLFLEANYQYSWSMNKSTKDTYNSGEYGISDGLPVFNPTGMVRDDIYSNSIVNESHNQRAGVSLSYQTKKFRAQLGAAANPTTTYNKTNEKVYENKVVNWAPQAMLHYDFSDNSNVRLYYNGRSNQPSTSQLMPVPDNSDPLNISLGNPYLQPYFNHNIRARIGYTNKKTFTSVNANIRGTITDNALTNAQWYDKSGVKYSIPVNGPAKTSLNTNIFFNTPFGKSGFSIFLMTFLNYGESVSYVGTNDFRDTKADLYYDKENATFRHEDFHRDYPSLDNAPDMFSVNKTQNLGYTQNLRLTYRNDFVELTAGARTRMNKSWYTLNKEVQPTWNNQVQGNMNWTIPGGLNLIAEARYNWYNGYTTAQEEEIILNAEITKLLFKNKFTLALKAYDILGQSKNLSVSDSANYHLETVNNTLGRYVILSLTYRFGTFNNRGGGQRGPGGRPGMGGPGMGGHPGMGGPRGFSGPPGR